MKNRNPIIALMLFAATAHAGINEDLNKFFQQLDSGSGGNITQAAAWQGQVAGYLTGGSLFLRNPVRQIQLVSVSLPEVKSGCGGIDAYLGSFSFINSDQIKVMAKQILSNAAGYAFDLALEAALPQVKAVKDYLQKLATDINNTNISTCQAAQGIIGGLWPKNQANTQHICQDIAGNHSVFADWAASRQGCGVGNETNKVFNHASDEEKKRIPRNRNLTWSAFEKINQFISSDRELKELMMSLVGTVIYGNQGELSILPGLGASDSVMDAILKGGTTEVYPCDNVTQCLKPTKSKITVTASQGMITQIQKLLSSLFKKSTSDAALTDKETALIGSTRVQILRYVIDSASLSLDESMVTSLAEYIASDMVVSYIDGLIDLVEVAGAGSLNTEEENKQFQNSLKTVREKMAQRLTRMPINQNHLLELERNLHYLRQQLSSGLSDRLMSNYQFGG
ncbi:conjugal transfer protein TraH [Arsenophonus sp. PmNCSU2021_1]|uniref:conjugal transfer protein TraH n=1 Tax=Arsenophonus sp. PmNCSU2021_1 TaxID=3118989 RepID=UPI002FF3AC8C